MSYAACLLVLAWCCDGSLVFHSTNKPSSQCNNEINTMAAFYLKIHRITVGFCWMVFQEIIRVTFDTLSLCTVLFIVGSLMNVEKIGIG